MNHDVFCPKFASVLDNCRFLFVPTFLIHDVADLIHSHMRTMVMKVVGYEDSLPLCLSADICPF